MDIAERVEAYLAGQPEPKQADLRRLHTRMLAEFPGCRLWFDDGTNADGKVVINLDADVLLAAVHDGMSIGRAG